MKKFRIFAAALFAALLAPAVASAATGYVITDLNVRAGPSTAYPVVDVYPGGTRVDVIGCTSGPGWCDVSAYGVRGWVSANYLDLYYDGYRARAPQLIGRVGVPTISFSIGTYWDNHYRDRSFYRYRDRRDWRQEWREERREDRREVRQERRQDKREVRQERRQEKRMDRRERRQEVRQERRQEKRMERRERRQEVRQDRRQERRADRREERREERRKRRRND